MLFLLKLARPPVYKLDDISLFNKTLIFLSSLQTIGYNSTLSYLQHGLIGCTAKTLLHSGKLYLTNVACFNVLNFKYTMFLHNISFKQIYPGMQLMYIGKKFFAKILYLYCTW